MSETDPATKKAGERDVSDLRPARGVAIWASFPDEQKDTP